MFTGAFRESVRQISPWIGFAEACEFVKFIAWNFATVPSTTQKLKK
jgi:hypothetical protein